MARRLSAPVWMCSSAGHPDVGRVARVTLPSGVAFGRVVNVRASIGGPALAYRVSVTGGEAREFAIADVDVVREREEGDGEGGVHHADTLRTDSVRRGVSR